MRYLYTILLLFTLILMTCNCKDDDLDPCFEVVPVNADFIIEQGLGFNEDRRYFASDTLTVGLIRFRALHDLDTYAWTIGDDPRVFDTKEVELDFDTDLAGSNIEVTLKGTWTPDLDCFPQDTGRASISKTFYITRTEDIPYLGDFKGIVESNPQDTFILNLVYLPIGSSAHFNNLPNGCERDFESSNSTITGVYRNFFMSQYIAYPECPIPKGWGHIEDNLRDLIIEYEIYNPATDERMNDKFIGTKIQ